jgi:hypothetical protein
MSEISIPLVLCHYGDDRSEEEESAFLDRVTSLTLFRPALRSRLTEHTRVPLHTKTSPRAFQKSAPIGIQCFGMPRALSFHHQEHGL